MPEEQNTPRGSPDGGKPPRRPRRRKEKEICKSYPELLTSAMLVTVGLTEGRSNQQVKTLLNFVNLLQSNINFVLAQRLIDGEANVQLDISLSDQ